MRRFLILLIVALPAFGATFESRSQQHSLTVEPTGTNPPGYTMTVTELTSGKVLSRTHFGGGSAAPMRGELWSDSRDLHVTVSVAPSDGALAAMMEVERNGVVVDSLAARWRTAAASASADERKSDAYRVGGDVKAPVLLYKVEPQYTNEAREQRISGIVILEVVIDKEGVVREARVLKPLPYGLSEAAVDAVKQWTFRPGTLNGEPVDVLFNLTVNFRIDKPPAHDDGH